MRTKDEINEMLLATYKGREEFSRISSKEKHPSELLKASFEIVMSVYTEKITTLEWVLNEGILDRGEAERS
jgi:hypothetical protein